MFLAAFLCTIEESNSEANPSPLTERSGCKKSESINDLELETA
jgi:hypothetical protein